MVSEGNVIRVQLTPAEFRLSVDEQPRLATVLRVRDTELRPVTNTTKYKRHPDRARNGNMLITCRDLVSDKVFSFYNGNAVTLEKLSGIKAMFALLHVRLMKGLCS